MTLAQAAVAAIFVATIVALVLTRWRPVNIFSGAILSLLAFNLTSLDNALEKAVNPGVVTLLALMLASRALERTVLLKQFARSSIEQSPRKSLLKLTSLTAFASAFLNNTAVVAALLRPVKNQKRVAASKLLLPLSYAAILGGTCTLIGTSTNMVVNSFWMDAGYPSLGFFDFLPVGLALVVVGTGVMLLMDKRLPDIHLNEKQKQYFVDIKIMPGSPLVGKSVSDNRLRNLNSFFLVEIIRRGQSLSPVQPSHIIETGDRLVFSGEAKFIDELQSLPGVKLFAEHSGLMSDNLIEVVLKNGSSLNGKTLKVSGFRAMFDAAVVGLKRNGLSVPGKLGEVVLKEGDSLLLATGSDFKSRKNLDRHFIIVSDLQVEQPLSQQMNFAIIGSFALVIGLAATGVISLLAGLVFFIAASVALNVTKSAELKRLFPFDLWLIITAALTLADAMMSSGLSQLLAEQLHTSFSQQPAYVAFIGILLATLILTELVTNNAAAALMFPLALSLAESFGVAPQSFVMAVAFGASASFLSPYGYQTNLIVFNSGGYKINDFIRYGLPMSFMYILVSSLLIPWFFPF
ncbi:SLC13 family permease [Gayadomonas joobiniege]|uniref:SLC13 family permease n=1 Tax=Gayadomonas joobiniege TaxID=1234606 RepID=UPI00037BF601|nr:SLC13 family permease [Gayadomonas joobiniege]